MPVLENLEARWATIEDWDFLSTAGVVRLPSASLRRKIEGQEIIVACEDQVHVGYAHIDYLWSYVPFIATVWVDEGMRSRGVGRTILMFLEEDARTKDAGMIYSSSQGDEIEPQAWHRRVGFRECGILCGHNEGVGEIFFRRRVG
jgi:N-acetylglutamate synthase-like GNAT family acetyltransferase